MSYYISGCLAAKIDKYTINEIGIPSVVLMEKAAMSVVFETLNAYGEELKTGDIYIFCGKGNNGADGLAIARLLYDKKYNVKIMIVGDILNETKEFELQFDIVKKIGIEIVILKDSQDMCNLNFENCAIVIDALFGIGLKRDISGINYEIIKRINFERQYGRLKKVVSVDIASGLDSLKGTVRKIAIKADMTVTFGFKKIGHIICEGKNYTGKLIICDVGFYFPDEINIDKYELNDVIFAIDKEDLFKLPKRKKTSNKGTYKNVNIIGAGENMSGAVALAGEAAYRSGCGLVKIYAGNNNINILKNLLREAVIYGYDKLDTDKAYNRFDENKDIIVIGPGFSTNYESEEILKKILKTDCKKILDADALNIISRNKILLKDLDRNTIITPHIKEMSRLMSKDINYIRENIIECAREFSKKYECITVLKDATTVVASYDGTVKINTMGNSGMSKGGSGDVLTGIIAGMLSQEMDIYDAACLGVYIHGCAGDIASEKLSCYSMVASDIISVLPDVFLNISNS